MMKVTTKFRSINVSLIELLRNELKSEKREFVLSDGSVARLLEYIDDLEFYRRIFTQIETLRQSEGNSVTVFCDNPEAESIEKQCAVEVLADFTDWKEETFWGKTWGEALDKACKVASDYYRRKEHGSGQSGA